MGLASCPDTLTQVNLIMFNPSPLHYTRLPPPMRPSRSLEGLEKVIPPKSSSNYPVSRTGLHLNKPLPAKPPTPDILPGRTGLSAWSDDSSIESFDVHSDPKDSTESFPIFVSSGSDDLNDLVDPPPAIESTLDDPDPDLDPVSVSVSDLDSDRDPDPPLDSPLSARSSLALNAFISEERYGVSHHPSWGQNRAGANHYFREKKWDFFPELATPSALSNSTFSYPAAAKGRKKDGNRLNLPGLDFGRNRSRWTSENTGLAIAHGVRDSIRSYVSRTLSKGENKSKRPGRPVTAPSISPYKYGASHQSSSLTDHSTSIGGSSSRQNSLDTCGEFGSLSISTNSSTNDHSDDTTQPPRRRKPLAVPLSPYQKYGASIWDKSGGPKKVNHGHHQVRFPKQSKNIPSRKPKHEALFSSSAPSLSLPHSPTHIQRDYVKALHEGTSHVRGALDDAKRRMSASKASRRREQLKSQIKLVGPVNPYTHTRVDPWL